MTPFLFVLWVNGTRISWIRSCLSSSLSSALWMSPWFSERCTSRGSTRSCRCAKWSILADTTRMSFFCCYSNAAIGFSSGWMASEMEIEM